eukprot:1188047-Prorocentrum_minimum.AAC.1
MPLICSESDPSIESPCRTGHVRVMLEGCIPYPYSPDTPTSFPPRVIPGMPYDPFLTGLMLE